MNWEDFFGQLIARARGGPGTASQEEGIQGSLLRVAFLLLDEYVQTDSPLSQELDRLLTAVGNRKDPLLKGLSVVTYMGTWATLNTIRAQRRAIRAQKK